MCITVEREHFKLVAARLKTMVSDLVAEAPTRGSEFLLRLEPGYAEAAIVFRDFPKRHGNLIRDAVKIALDGHVGGRSQSEKRFTFLSGMSVAIDNFFVSATGQIYLFETKRDFRKVRLTTQQEAARSLKEVADHFAAYVATRTGKQLRFPIICAFFSYIDPVSPCGTASLNIGTNASPTKMDFPVLGRQEMNTLIGSCFGQFIDDFDDFVGSHIGDLARGIRLADERQVSNNPLKSIFLDEVPDAMQFGDQECEAASEADILA